MMPLSLLSRMLFIYGCNVLQEFGVDILYVISTGRHSMMRCCVQISTQSE